METAFVPPGAKTARAIVGVERLGSEYAGGGSSGKLVAILEGGSVEALVEVGFSGKSSRRYDQVYDLVLPGGTIGVGLSSSDREMHLYSVGPIPA